MERARVGVVCILGGLAAAVACGRQSSGDNAEVCDDPVCCSPVEFDAERSRAYLVDGQLALFLATKGEVWAGGSVLGNGGHVEAEVTSALTQATRCDAPTLISASGLNGQHCAVPAAADLSCGQQVVFDLGLRPTERDPETGESLCSDAAPFSTRVVWTATVTCAECPPEARPGEVCDHPPALQCSYGTSGSFCGPSTVRLPCTCTGWSVTGEATWSCAVC